MPLVFCGRENKKEEIKESHGCGDNEGGGERENLKMGGGSRVWWIFLYFFFSYFWKRLGCGKKNIGLLIHSSYVAQFFLLYNALSSSCIFPEFIEYFRMKRP